MNKKQIEHFRNKLINEKHRVENLIEMIKEYGPIKSDDEAPSELSFYDNHTADTGTEAFDVAKEQVLKRNEMGILHSIEDSIEDIKRGSYGKCCRCGKDISIERLEVMPYAKRCIECENVRSEIVTGDKHKHPWPDKALDLCFSYSYDRSPRILGLDTEDAYQMVESFNYRPKIYDDGIYNEEGSIGAVEEIDNISNQQYKNQLPD